VTAAMHGSLFTGTSALDLAVAAVSGRRGQPQLNPGFVEWLMGLPAGWVTGVDGLSRNDMLRVLGNGVVPHQAVAALRWLLAFTPFEVRQPRAA
jgi:hypothetical protein